jgi:uncharacterized protein
MLRAFGRLFAATAMITLLAASTGFGVHALDVPPKPTASPVVDQTDTLSSEQRAQLEQKIAAERSSTGNQIAILMIPSLEGEVLEDYSIKVARGWGIGQKERDSGVLLLVVKNDRQVRIEVGYGLEGALPDIRAGQIVRDRMIPEFRQGKYFEGINDGVDGIIKAIHGEADPSLKEESTVPFENGDMLGNLFFFGIFILMWAGSILGRSKRWWPGGAIGAAAGAGISFIPELFIPGLLSIIPLTILGLLFDKVVSTNYRTRTNDGLSPSWWAGGGGYGGGSRGGGFGGFGGGSFGGGGASGRW